MALFEWAAAIAMCDPLKGLLVRVHACELALALARNQYLDNSLFFGLEKQFEASRIRIQRFRLRNKLDRCSALNIVEPTVPKYDFIVTDAWR
jgi:hypothetical protein